jgi:hypothetical protein
VIISGCGTIRGLGFGYIVRACQNAMKHQPGFCMDFLPDDANTITNTIISTARTACGAWLL